MINNSAVKKLIAAFLFLSFPAFAEIEPMDKVVFPNPMDTVQTKERDLVPPSQPRLDKAERTYISGALLAGVVQMPGWAEDTVINGAMLNGDRETLAGMTPVFFNVNVGYNFSRWGALFFGGTFAAPVENKPWAKEAGGPQLVWGEVCPLPGVCYPGYTVIHPENYDLTVRSSYYEIFAGTRFNIGDASGSVGMFGMFGLQFDWYVDLGISYNNLTLEYSGDLSARENFSGVSPLFGTGFEISFPESQTVFDIGLRMTGIGGDNVSGTAGVSMGFKRYF
ncbi:MAG: hypothetical protein LBK26_01590 [Rickettsiales bacterium]|jgi:hypothetical protein|nr:hypothetical protein [Rickettsiales bacterium]